jgi:hypothetical protein
MPQVQEIADEEHELTFERVAAIDVGKQWCACGCRADPGRAGAPAGCGLSRPRSTR